MNKTEFLEKFSQILQYEHDEKLSYETNLIDIEEWDSLSLISTVAFFDSEFDKNITVKDLQNADTIGDLAKIAGVN